MLTVPAPASFDGARLREQLAQDGVVLGANDLYLAGDRLVFPGLGAGHRAAVQSALTSHLDRPLPADAAIEFQAAVKAATTLDALKSALLGTSGPGAEPRRPAR